MRVRSRAFVTLLLLLISLPAFAQWQWGRPRPPRDGACFYMDPGFRGNYFCLRPGERWPDMPRGFNDRITAVRVFRGTRVRIFNDANFSGPSLLLDQDVPDLRLIPVFPGSNKTWNDRISSIVVFRGRDRWERQYPPGRPYPPPRAY